MGSVILWVTSASTTLPRSMLKVSQSFWARMQVEMLNTSKWATTLELAAAMADYIDNFYNVAPTATAPTSAQQSRVDSSKMPA